jgi:hypothetical protein
MMPDRSEDQHADHGPAWAVAVKQQAARYLHCGKAEEESSCKPTKSLRPDRQIAHQVRPIVTFEARRNGWLRKQPPGL